MSNVVIKVENLSKKYTIRHQQRESYTALRDVLANKARMVGNRVRSALCSLRPAPCDQPSDLSPHPSVLIPSREDFWALKDVSFEVKQGEVIGIIGRNGAGKSTLLKILSRITEPTTGRVKIKGRVASLLEVGTGFHPELTGRENIYLNGAILGMTKAEIKRKFDEIVAFAEIDKFLDTPVKRYSSGMYVRLAFAVAAHLEPEILLVDEVLAVGDAVFQKKCLGKMKDVSTKEGRTVLFVSHNMGAVHTLTSRCLYLNNGEVFFNGESSIAIKRYLTYTVDNAGELLCGIDYYRPDHYRREAIKDKPVSLVRIWVNDETGKIPVINMGEGFTVFIELEVRSEIKGANLSFGILNSEGQSITVFFSWDKNYYLNLKPGRRVAKIVVNELNLTPCRYFVNVGINQSTETNAWDGVQNFPLFEMRNSGKVVSWLHRPWGLIHWDKVDWGCE